MKRLLAIFVVLLVLAVLTAVGGFLIARAGSPSGAHRVVLVWRMAGPLVEQPANDSLPFPGMATTTSMAEVYSGLRAARTDEKVRGLAVYIESTGFGLAKAQELRRQFEGLRTAGKFVECYLETAGELSNGTLAYYLATACDAIHMAPAGDLNLLGLYADGRFFRRTLDKLKIDPEISAVGDYKSAVESYEREGWSPAAREALDAVLDSYYRQIISAIAERRNLPEEAVSALFDRAPYTATEALELGLLDRLAYPDQFRSYIEERTGSEPRLVPLLSYGQRHHGSGPTVAIVFSSGLIVRGGGGRQPFSATSLIGSTSMSRVLRDLADDEAVKAVVIRIDSPGGSALASDLILRELELLSETKPVVVSMSDVAASGGYYIASKASRIVAEPATLTGSIGVFGGKLVTVTFEEDLLGITHDPMSRGANAGIYSPTTPFTPDQQERFDRLLNRIYDTFLNHVAEGRGMARSEVEAMAQGRVWTGEDAFELGLVDDLGGLDRAIGLALEEADLDPAGGAKIVYYPKPSGLLDWLIDRQKPSLPTQLAPIFQALEQPSRGLLQLPSEVAAVSAPF